jgi:hypothetical protein
MPIKLVKENDNLTLVKNMMKGDPGDSAYEIALENGFEGTEEEWLASLQGEDGVPGVYVGAEEPTDADTLVWVDPDEDADVVVTLEEITALGYQTEAQVKALINAALTEVENGSY